MTWTRILVFLAILAVAIGSVTSALADTTVSQVVLGGPEVRYLNPVHNFSMDGTVYTDRATTDLKITGAGYRFHLELARNGVGLTWEDFDFYRFFGKRLLSFNETLCLFGKKQDGDCNTWPIWLPNGEYEFRTAAFDGNGSYKTDTRRIVVQLSMTSTPPVVTIPTLPTECAHLGPYPPPGTPRQGYRCLNGQPTNI